jgi:hypothetical protein
MEPTSNLAIAKFTCSYNIALIEELPRKVKPKRSLEFL